MRKSLVVLALLAVAILALVFLSRPATPPVEVIAPAPRSLEAASVTAPQSRPPTAPDEAAPTPSPSRPDPRQAGSPLAAELNSPAFDARHDVATLHSILRQYLRLLHGRQGRPIGNDSDLALALTGHNPMHVIILPPSHPALASDGRLRDRWGTPYFIHPRGNLAFEIRSAGPDRKLFTNDDLIENPGGARTDLNDLPPLEDATPP